MRKLLGIGLLVGVLMLVAAGPASADNFIGEFCWGLQGFTDVIKLGVSSGGKQYGLHGSWSAPGSYEMPAVGSAFVQTDGTIAFAIQAGNGFATMYAGNPLVIGNAVLTGGLSGPFHYAALGGSTPFTPGTVTMSPMTCPSGPVAPQAPGVALPAAGQ